MTGPADTPPAAAFRIYAIWPDGRPVTLCDRADDLGVALEAGAAGGILLYEGPSGVLPGDGPFETVLARWQAMAQDCLAARLRHRGRVLLFERPADAEAAEALEAAMRRTFAGCALPPLPGPADHPDPAEAAWADLVFLTDPATRRLLAALQAAGDGPTRTPPSRIAALGALRDRRAAPAGPDPSEAVTGILLRQVAELEEALRDTVRAQAKRAGSDGKRP